MYAHEVIEENVPFLLGINYETLPGFQIGNVVGDCKVPAFAFVGAIHVFGVEAVSLLQFFSEQRESSAHFV